MSESTTPSSSSSASSGADSVPRSTADSANNPPVGNTSGNAGSPGDSAEPKKRRLSRQDKVIQAYITDAEVFLKIAAGDGEIRALLEARGYDAAEFAAGQALVTTARSAFEDRAGAMGEQNAGTAKVLDANLAARHEYARFRSIARASFPEKSDRLALSLTGDVPEDTAHFITLATASWSAGKKPPFSEKLTRRGYPAATLDLHLTELQALTEIIAGHDESEGDAIADTAARDSAYKALRSYMSELKGVAKGALRGQSPLLAKLGL